MPNESKSRRSRKAKQRKNLTGESEPCIQILISKFDEMSIKTETADNETHSKFQFSESSLKKGFQNGGMIFSFDEKNFKTFPQEISKTSLAVLSALENKASAEDLTVKQEPLDDFSEEIMTRDIANVACNGDINIKQETSDDIEEKITQIRFKAESKFKENVISSETSHDLASLSYTGDINIKQETSDDFSEEINQKTIKTEPIFNDGNKNSKTIEASTEDVNAKQEPLDYFSEEMTRDLANIACTRYFNIKQETSDGISEEITQLKFKAEPKFKENVRSSKTSRDLANLSYTGDINIKQETSDDFSEEMTRKTIKTERKFNDGDKNSKTIYKLTNEIKVSDIFADSSNSRDPIMHSRSSSTQYTNNTERVPSNSGSHTQEYSGDNDRNFAFENKAIFTKVKSNIQSLNCNSSLFLNDNIRIKKEAGNDYGDNQVSKEIDVYGTPENREEEFERNCDKSRKRIKIEPNFIDNGEDGNTRDTPSLKMETQSVNCRGRLKDTDSAMPKERKPGTSRKAEQSSGDMQSNSSSLASSSSRKESQSPKIKRRKNVIGKSETCIQNFDNYSDTGTSFIHDIRTDLEKSISENAEEHIVGCLQGIKCDPAIEESVIPEYDTIIKLDNELFVSTTLSEMLDVCAGRLRIPNAFDEVSIKTETSDNIADSKFQNSESSLREGIQKGGMIFSFDENNFKIFPHEISPSAFAVLRASANKPSTENANVKQESLRYFSEEMNRDLTNVPCTGDINIKQEISDGISEDITRIRFKTEPKFKENVKSSETSRDLSNVAFTGDINKKQETSDNFSEKMNRETFNTDPKFNDGNKNSKTIEASTEDVNAKQEPLDYFSEEMTRDLANIACTRYFNIKQETSDGISEEITQLKFKAEPKFKENVRSSETSPDLPKASYTGDINIKQETSDDFSEEMTRKTIKTEPKFNDGDKNSKTIHKLTNVIQVSDIFVDSSNSRDRIMHSRSSSSQYTNNTERALLNSGSHTQECSGDNDRNCAFENKAIFMKVESIKESLNYNSSLFLNNNIRIKKEAGNDYGDNTVSKKIDLYGTSINREEECERHCDNTRKRIKIKPNFIDDGNKRDTPCIKKEIQSEDCRGRAKKSSLKGSTFYLNTRDTPEFHTDASFSSVNENHVLSALKTEKEPLKNKKTSEILLSKRIQIVKEEGNDTESDTAPKETDIICNISLKRKTHDEEIQQVILKRIKSEPFSMVLRKEKERAEPKRIKSELISFVSQNEKEEITTQKIKSERNSAVPEKDRNFQVLTLSDDDGKFISLSGNENEFITLLDDSDKIEESSRTEMGINRISAVASTSSGVSDSLSKNEDFKRTSEKKELSSKVLKDFSVQKKSRNCENAYLIEVKREMTGPTIQCLNVKDENNLKMSKNLKLNPIPIYHSEITCYSSYTPDWYCFEETSEKKVFSSDILKYFSVASELDRADIQKTLDYLKQTKTKNNFGNLFNIPKKPKLRTSFGKRDILFQNSPNSANEKNDNIGCHSIKKSDVKCESEPVIQFNIAPNVQSAITSRDSSSTLV